MTWPDVRHLVDTHGVVVTSTGAGHRSPEAKLIHLLVETWIARQHLRPGLPYAMPLRVLVDTISLDYRHLIALPTGGVSWHVLVDAVNDPESGLTVASRPYRTRRAA